MADVDSSPAISHESWSNGSFLPERTRTPDPLQTDESSTVWRQVSGAEQPLGAITQVSAPFELLWNYRGSRMRVGGENGWW
ncbi:MAG: hypothetical protein ACREVT_13220, partial [Burkholderiales bacterium]